MIGFLKAIPRRSIFRDLEGGGFHLDTRDPVAMVREWNSLRAESRDLDSNFNLATHHRNMLVSKKMRAIEEACVVSHRSITLSPEDVSQLAITSARQNIFYNLKRCDRESINIINVRIAKRINADNAWIAQKILGHLSEVSDNDTPELRTTLSDMVWILVAAYYEIEVISALGKPDNIYVALNIRDLFSSSRDTYYRRNGVDADEGAISGWIGVFAEFLPSLPIETSQQKIGQLAGLIQSISTQGVAGGFPQALNEALAKYFYEFVESRNGSVLGLIRAE